jgi:hypothetical protein
MGYAHGGDHRKNGLVFPWVEGEVRLGRWEVRRGVVDRLLVIGHLLDAIR